MTNILRDMNGMEHKGAVSVDSRIQGASTSHPKSLTKEVGNPVIRILNPGEPLPRLLEAHLYKLNEQCSLLTDQWYAE